MTKKQKLRRNGIAADFGGKEDDFILADLDVMRDQEELSPVPLNHFLDDEETIDRLLINSGFEANDELKEDDREPDALVIDDIDLADDFSGFDRFVIEPVEQAEQNRHRESEKISPLNLQLVTDSDEIPDEEDAIDRLLVNTGFDVNDEQKEDDGAPDALVIDDASRANAFGENFEGQNAMAVDAGICDSEGSELVLDKDATNVFLKKDENPETVKLEQVIGETTYPEEASESLNNNSRITSLSAVKSEQEAIIKQINDFLEEQNPIATHAGICDSEGSELVLDKDVTNVFLKKDENPEIKKQEQAIGETTYPEEVSESLNNAAEISTLSSVKSEQEAIRKQINDYENKVKRANIISFTSLSIGLVALLSTVVMGVIVSSVQTKVSKLTELVSILEEDMSSIAERNSDMEINNSGSSSEQLYRKVNGLPEQFEQQTQFSSDIRESKMKTVVTKQTTVNKSLGNPKIRASVLEKKKLPEATVEKVSAEKKAGLQRHLIEQSQSSTDLSKNHKTAVAKKQAANNKTIDNRKTKTHVVEKRKPSETTVKTTSAKKKTNNAKATADWAVNLTAYKERSYAKSKAAKYIKKGIPVKVIGVDMNNTTWYRLKVGGFKNKEEATSYAAKIKKSLNLNSVSVGNN
jgi:cell division protein FtsN